MKNICRICKEPFETDIPHKKLCSTKCRKKYSKNYKRNYYRNRYKNDLTFRKKVLGYIKKYSKSEKGIKKRDEYADKHKEESKLWHKIYERCNKYKTDKRE